MEKILVLGGTGAMGVYLVPELLKKGYKVDVCSLDDCTSDDPNLTYYKINVMDIENLKKMLANGYDAIVDFMIYVTAHHDFKDRYELFLKNTKHYIYLSTYRIYADEEHPVKETSPRLLETSRDEKFLAARDNEYSLYKAEGEDTLRNSPYNNFTIIRPSITYSKRRFQLTTLEANVLIKRIRENKVVALPEGALDKEACMTWAGDSAKFYASVILNPKAYGETYSFATAEHHTWREIAEYYKKIAGLRYVGIPDEDYLKILSGGVNYDGLSYQLFYDREFDRVMDNSKILALAGMSQSEMTPLYDGLKREYDALPADAFTAKNDVSDRMSRYLAEKGLGD